MGFNSQTPHIVVIPFLGNPLPNSKAELEESVNDQTYPNITFANPDHPEFTKLTKNADYIWYLSLPPTPQAAHILLSFLKFNPDHIFVRGQLPGPGEFRAREFYKRPHQLQHGLLVKTSHLPKSSPPTTLLELTKQIATSLSNRTKGTFLPVVLHQPQSEQQLSEPTPLDTTDIFEGLDPQYFQSREGRPQHNHFTYTPLTFAPPQHQPNYKNTLLLLPHFAVGGSDKFNHDLATQLSTRHNHQLSFIGTLSKENAWQSQFEDISPHTYLLQTFLTRPHFPAFITQHIIDNNIGNVILSHSTLAYQLLPWLRSLFPQVRFIDYLHIEEEWGDGGYPRQSIRYQHHLHSTIVSSQHLSEWMTQNGGDTSKIHIATTNIEPEDWKPEAQQSHPKTQTLPPTTPLILFAGRLTPQKQPLVLAETLRILHEKKLNFHCLIAGVGELQPQLEQATNNLENVTLIGNQTPQEIRQLLARTDIFFIPSDNEGIALANYEAMSMECAIVGSDVGGQAELITPETGLLIPHDQRADPKAYAQAIETLLQNPDQTETLKKQARQHIIENFRIDQMGDKIDAVINNVTPQAPSTVPAPLLQRHIDEIIELFRIQQQLYRIQQTSDKEQEEITQLQSQLEQLKQNETINLQKIDDHINRA